MIIVYPRRNWHFRTPKILATEGGSPGSVINRAYYAMFYTVLALLLQIEKGTSKHSGAITLFDAEFVKKGIFPKTMSQSLHKAFDLRQTSDYRELVKINLKEARELLANAKEFVEKVKEFLA